MRISTTHEMLGLCNHINKDFISGEDDPKQRNKYIRQYNRLKKDLKEKYDVSDFPDYK